ncbi:MHYT domain-containing protein [Rhizobium sp. SL86]|uniref:MHYT domain-containing protein n=1 Tax=Rhizobium sp. SL86 TaxID=2995148 RepID=UPI0022760518|nr:MHYT domain-containing protein [Rhizobium sp. SL86]MCY1666631.1 LytTR family transcriptional regulator DNA-binding domain-containing protein [Rhizobium sp. SL86]
MTELTSSFSYNPILVVLSVVVAIQAGYVGISLALLIPGAFANRRRLLIAGSAITLAVGIWSMHFIGMLAITTSVAIDYAVVPTLLSFLICSLVTGVAIYLASLRSQRLMVIAAALMGIGITTMHYVGMAAVHSVFHLTHDPAYVLASIAIAIAASGLALWLAFSADRRPPLFLCAVVLGCAVSGMHYMAMAGTTLHLATAQLANTTSLMSGDILAAIVSVVACSISAVFMLALIPSEAREAHGEHLWRAAHGVPNDPLPEGPHADAPPPDLLQPAEPRLLPGASGPAEPTSTAALLAPILSAGDLLLPIEKNGKRFHIAADDIVSVHSNAHYTYIFNGRDDLFCPLSISDIAARLPEAMFSRIHRGYIVNLVFVVRIKKAGDSGVVELDSPIRRTVPVSRSRLAGFRTELAAFKASQSTASTGHC